jgi:phage terminase large subunit GpA-like protein
VHEGAKPDSVWLAEQFESLTSELVVERPSTWAERKRYLPQAATVFAGPYRFAVTPYLREIIDCLSVDSPVREVVLMKGVQIGATVGVLENLIGYYIDHVATAPMMWVTADAELAKLRLETSVTPMLQFSGLLDRITSSDENNPRKTGRTDKKIEWAGGGFLIPFGAQNANKLRSISIRIMLRDEVDGWPDVVGKDGDPMKLTGDRCAAFEEMRKILDISTPLIKGQSKIARRYHLGDQRKYNVCCLRCGFPQVLCWRETSNETGEVFGIVWETEQGRLVPDSVRYICRNCSHAHSNNDKTRLLSPDHGAEWRPTAVPISHDLRSYHLSALYSPVGMQSWAMCVQKYLEAWDVEHNRVRDPALYQVFQNNVKGEPYEVLGEQVRFEAVSAHRRHDYVLGQVPNRFATAYLGSPVLLLTCAVDVHADNLACAVIGWCRGRRAVLVDYTRFYGDTEQVDNPATWGRLHALIDRNFEADDGAHYRIQATFVDSGYRHEQVYTFAQDYEDGVYPVKGRDVPSKNAKFKEFSEFKTELGTRAFLITVDMYKDRWSAALKRGWDGASQQPECFFNAPLDIEDKQLKELTVEVKREKIDKVTRQRLGFEWFRPSGAANELWDCLVYCDAALDALAADLCIKQLGMDDVDWTFFYDSAEKNRLYIEA